MGVLGAMMFKSPRANCRRHASRPYGVIVPEAHPLSLELGSLGSRGDNEWYFNNSVALSALMPMGLPGEIEETLIVNELDAHVN